MMLLLLLLLFASDGGQVGCRQRVADCGRRGLAWRNKTRLPVGLVDNGAHVHVWLVAVVVVGGGGGGGGGRGRGCC